MDVLGVVLALSALVGWALWSLRDLRRQ